MRFSETIPSDKSAHSLRPLAVCVAALFSAAYFAVSWQFTGPGYLNDEVGYLLNAAALTGDRIDGASSYHFGYSLLIAPAFIFADDPAIIWRFVQALNAIMFGVSFVALDAIARRLAPEAPSTTRLSAVALCALSPIVVVMAGYSFATPAFVLVYTLSVLALIDGRRRMIVAHGALVGFLFWVHPTAAGVAVASMAALALLAIRTGLWVGAISAVALEVGAILSYRLVLAPALTQAMTPAGFEPTLHYETISLAKLTLPALMELAVRGAGQLSYVIIGTLGFAALGFAACLSLATKATRPTDQAAGLYMALSLLGAAAVGSLLFTILREPATDTWMYGRYIEGTVLPLLVLGLLAARYRWWTAAACALIPLAFLVMFHLTSSAFPIDRTDEAWGINLVNVASFWPLALPTGAPLAAAILLGGAAAAFAVLLPRRIAMGAVAASFALSIYQQFAWHDFVLARMSKPSAIPDIVRSAWPSGSCVGLDPSFGGEEVWRVHLYKFHLHDYDIRRVTFDDWRDSCDGPFIAASFTPSRPPAGTKLIGREVNSEVLLVARGESRVSAPESADGLYPADSVCMTSERCFSRSAEETWRLKQTRVGVLIGNELRATGVPGYLFFGPGTPFKAGKYRVTLDADIVATGDDYIDVIDGLSDIKTLARFSLSPNGREFDIELSEPAKALQIRAFVMAGSDVRMRRYTLSSLD